MRNNSIGQFQRETDMIRIKWMSDHQYRVLKCKPGPDTQVGILKLNKYRLSYVFAPNMGTPLSSSDVQGLNRKMEELNSGLLMDIERVKRR